MGLEDRGEDRRHRINGLLAIGVAVSEDIGALHQRIDEGREALAPGMSWLSPPTHSRAKLSQMMRTTLRPLYFPETGVVPGV